MSMPANVPPYFDFLIDAFRRGANSRFVHLGYWDEPQQADVAGMRPEEFAKAQQRLNERLLDMADLAPGQKILDVGCGFGGTLEAVNRHWSNMQLTGVNIDSRQLDICRQIVPASGNTLQWQQADACRLPFAANSFDRVLCIEAMFHFGSRRAFFLEAARVLKPGGVLVGSDIIFSDAVRDRDTTEFAIEAWLQQAYGPWPDFWCADADHAQLANVAGLHSGTLLDVSANVLPSHRYTAPCEIEDPRCTGNPALRAALMLRWLHRQGHMRYWHFRFVKPEIPVGL